MPPTTASNYKSPIIDIIYKLKVSCLVFLPEGLKK